MTQNDITVSGKRVRVRTAGAGPALLLLHSAWGDAELSWERVWDELSSSFFVIAPDMPGFGASERPDQPSLAGTARVMKEVLDRERQTKAIVVGNSFGVAAAIEFAGAYPDRTERLVLVNGGYLPAIPGFIRKVIAIPPIEKRFHAFMRSFVYSDQAFAKAFPNPGKLPPQFFDRIRRNEESQSRIVFDTFMSQTKIQARPSLPVALIWGTGDSLVTAKQLAQIRKWVGEHRFFPIAGAGHLPQVDAPQLFVEAVKKAAGM